MSDSNASIDRVIEIDGQQLSPEVELSLESTTVVDRLAMPDTFTLEPCRFSSSGTAALASDQ